MPRYKAIVSYVQHWEIMDFEADNAEDAEQYAMENYDEVGRFYDGDITYSEVTEVESDRM